MLNAHKLTYGLDLLWELILVKVWSQVFSNLRLNFVWICIGILYGSNRQPSQWYPKLLTGMIVQNGRTNLKHFLSLHCTLFFRERMLDLSSIVLLSVLHYVTHALFFANTIQCFFLALFFSSLELYFLHTHKYKHAQHHSTCIVVRDTEPRLGLRFFFGGDDKRIQVAYLLLLSLEWVTWMKEAEVLWATVLMLRRLLLLLLCAQTSTGSRSLSMLFNFVSNKEKEGESYSEQTRRKVRKSV